MHHDMEALNTVMQIQSTLVKNFPIHTLGVELGERVFTPSSDKIVTVVVLCAPYWAHNSGRHTFPCGASQIKDTTAGRQKVSIHCHVSC